jgi:hypothetical protein
MPATIRTMVATTAVVVLLVGPAVSRGADARSDAPDARVVDPARVTAPPTYDEALRVWRSAEDVNAWIGAKFEYDMPRALRLSETQRGAAGPFPIHSPSAFFASPRGVCVDLSRFAVEVLRAIEPDARPAYLMIEFAPVTIAGNTLRRHWLVSFQRGGQHYFFADSKRPGFLAGPYASTQAFIEEYARYREREVVAHRELDSYERTTRTRAVKHPRDSRP